MTTGVDDGGVMCLKSCEVGITHIGRGCQRHTNCLAWSKAVGVVAFASAGDLCFAVDQGGGCCKNIKSTVNAHGAPITCLKFLSWYQNKSAPNLDYLVVGAANGEVSLWNVKRHKGAVDVKVVSECSKDSGKPVNPVTYCSGAAKNCEGMDTVIIAYSVPNGLLVAEEIILRNDVNALEKRNYETISFQPAFIVSLAAHIVSNTYLFIIVGKTDNNIDVLCTDFAHKSPQFRKAVTLRGHTDWICSLDVRAYGNDIFIASGGQDNSIRIWQFSADNNVQSGSEMQLEAISFSLSDGEVNDKSSTMYVTLQTILCGHDDWIYTVEWHPNKLQLLSASNDKTIIIWEPNEIAAGLWLDKVRVGIIGGQAVGFLGACFSPDASLILAYSFFGSFFAWQQENVDDDDARWKGVPTFGGHSGAVKDIAWDPSGSYLLSCSSDQTTRCYAPFYEQDIIVELARPQVHGYDLTCITSLSSSRFVSGADEKILRVFNVPRNFVQILEVVSKYDWKGLLPDSATEEYSVTVPALGLSNIAHKISERGSETVAHDGDINREGLLPTEEHLMQNTLWLEVHKIYGHGFEVFCVASSHSGQLIASACKASCPRDATIIIWDTEQWKCRCELKCHRLTVTQLAFSNNDCFLLSVSRDRTFAVSARSDHDPYDWKLLLTSEQRYSKEHTRIIWCCAWASDDEYFVTGSRDCKLCVWRFDGKEVELFLSSYHPKAVTAAVFVPEKVIGLYVVVVGLENGEVQFLYFEKGGNKIENIDTPDGWSPHSGTVNKLRFRPKKGSWLNAFGPNRNGWELASASDDNSVKVHHISFSC